ncbi:MAG: hypothetical protein ACI3W6_07340 [Clostridia bacterium]
MEIKNKISLDVLNEDSVTVKMWQYIEVDGEALHMGELHAKAYMNSERGREELAEEVPEPYLSAVLSVWGEEPTVEETVS